MRGGGVKEPGDALVNDRRKTLEVETLTHLKAINTEFREGSEENSKREVRAELRSECTKF